MWKCPNCETLNEKDSCMVCGEVRPGAARKSKLFAKEDRTKARMPAGSGKLKMSMSSKTSVPSSGDTYTQRAEKSRDGYYDPAEETTRGMFTASRYSKTSSFKTGDALSGEHETYVGPDGVKRNRTILKVSCTLGVVALIIIAALTAYWYVAGSDKGKSEELTNQTDVECLSETSENPLEEKGENAEKTEKTEEVKPTETEENSRLFDDEEAFLLQVKSKLNVPSSLPVTSKIGTPYYWELGKQELVYVAFFDNGKVVASADCNTQNGNPVRYVWEYEGNGEKQGEEKPLIPIPNLKPKAEPEYKIFTDPKYGFTLEIPKTMIEDPLSGEGRVRLTSPDGDLIIDLEKEEIPKSARKNEKAFYEYKKDNLTFDGDYGIRDDGWFVFTGTDGDYAVLEGYVFINDKTAESVRILCPRVTERDMENIIMHIFYSFRKYVK